MTIVSPGPDAEGHEQHVANSCTAVVDVADEGNHASGSRNVEIQGEQAPSSNRTRAPL